MISETKRRKHRTQKGTEKSEKTCKKLTKKQIEKRNETNQEDGHSTKRRKHYHHEVELCIFVHYPTTDDVRYRGRGAILLCCHRCVEKRQPFLQRECCVQNFLRSFVCFFFSQPSVSHRVVCASPGLESSEG